MDEDFVDVTQSGNKMIAFVLILIIIGISVFGYFFVFQKFHFSLKTVKVEIGSELSEDVNDYLSKKVVDTSGYKLDISKVKTDEVATYTYSVTYNNRTKKGKVKVVDSKPPVFETRDVTIEAGDEDFYLGDFLSACEDSSKPCIVSLKNPKDEAKFAKPGTYTLTIVVADVQGNKSTTSVKLTVVEKGTLVREEENDLTFAKASEELLNFNNEYYIKLDKALAPDSEEAKETASEIDIDTIEKYVAANYPDYKLKNAEIIYAYNKGGYVIGYIVRLTIDNGGYKTVYMTE